MLVLTRKKGEQIVITLGTEIVVVRIAAVTRDRVRLGVIAPPSMPVHREEVARHIEQSQQRRDANRADAVPQP